MVTLFLFLTLLMTPKIVAAEDLIKVAVIDTGISPEYSYVQCPNESKDFTGQGLKDIRGHGTNVAGIIDMYIKNKNYCQITLKYFHKNNYYNSVRLTVKAFKYAIQHKVNIINYSSSGRLPNLFEKRIILKALKKGIIVVVPSGNDKLNLDKKCNVYPACYFKHKNFYVIGRSDDWQKKESGYGNRVDRYYPGKDIWAFGRTLTGTSMSTARATAELINEMMEKK